MTTRRPLIISIATFVRRPLCFLATRRWLLLLPSILAFGLDRASKAWMVDVTLRTQQPVIADLGINQIGVSLSLSINYGVAFGFLRNLGAYSQLPLVLGSSLLSLLFLHFALQKSRATLGAVAASLIVGGALGNLYDRIAYQGVLDFIDAYAYNYHWYKFNIADVAISCGIALWLYSEIIGEIFPRPKQKR